jgi:hypothetical protein
MIHEDIEKALSFIPGFDDPTPAGTIDLEASNFKRGVKYSAMFEREFKFPHHPLPNTPFAELVFAGGIETASARTFDEPPHEDESGFAIESKLEGEIQGWFPSKVPGAYGILGAAVEATYATEFPKHGKAHAKVEVEITAFAGIGVHGHLGPVFEFKVYYLIGAVVVLGAPVKVGGMLKLVGEVDLKVVKIGVEAEAKLLFSWPPGKTVAEGTAEIALHVCLFMVFSIDVTYEHAVTAEIG